jgi:signal transduction histidine kinase
MEEKLVPAHIFFAKWFIRIRWVALGILIVSNYIVARLLDIPICEIPLYILSGILFLLNVSHRIILQRITRETGSKVTQRIKRDIHFQIITDLIILTLILHYSGGIENPLILFYFFHLIIASSIFSTFQSYVYAFFALILAASMALLECFLIIPHYSLTGFVSHELYKNVFYVFGAGFIFTCTSVMVVALSHMIIYRSIKTEETYVKTNIELENKDKLKNEYVLRVTHDIKGHIAAILSCLEVARSKMTGSLNEVQEEFTTRAYERTELLSGFIKDLLNLTKKRLKHDVEIEEFSLTDLITRVVKPLQILMQDKSINFNMYLDKSVGIITGNPFTIEELYSNLLLNAVKYTPIKGHIELTVKARQNHIITEISDSGIGIPKEDLPKVFDEFYRASNVPKDIKSGSGLGLSIARQIVEDHKGKIWVTSEVGVWTKFTFILPKKPEITSGFSGVRINFINE